jgi:hypothetical protein
MTLKSSVMGLLQSDQQALPDSKSLDLSLDHPTPDECVTIWTNTSASWKDSLTIPVYLEESCFLTTVPLAKDGGMTQWVLVDKNLPPDQRHILCSCESFRKRSLTSDSNGVIRDTIVHGIASVFCPPKFRGRGYAPRMMRELAKILHKWQSEEERCIGSILYSDIGKTYYAKLGWQPNITNSHVVFHPSKRSQPLSAKNLSVKDLPNLCKLDEAMIRKVLANSTEAAKTRMTIVPDLNHMLWHISKEEFACNELFGEVPYVKGAISGLPGNRIWAIWTHRYYGHPDGESPDNVLYILRLVIENQELSNGAPSGMPEGLKVLAYKEQIEHLKAVLEVAQNAAAEWRLDQINLWDPSPVIQRMIAETGIEHSLVEREEESIASGLWYDENGCADVAPLWINNEHYAWL